MEKWKAVKGWDEKYEVSNCGRVRNIISGSLIKQHDNGVGYKKVHLWRDGVGEKRVYVHRLVADAFLSNDEAKLK